MINTCLKMIIKFNKIFFIVLNNSIRITDNSD
jgi:hypothetical protein